MDTPFRQSKLLDTIPEYKTEISKMFQYCETLFDRLINDQLVIHDPALKMKVPWGQYYDIDQLMEHAIVHILRHRRQIERFLIKLR